jgi:mono/diheme cytochrome c family protein
MRRTRSLLGVLPLLALSVSTAGAQPASGKAARSTTDGVYTSAQARQGADVYAGLCQSCHSAESHTGAPFRSKWVGRPLSDLFEYIRAEMPKTEPGSLSEEDYTLVLAYMLRMNGMPAGRRELTADSALLGAIRIALPDGGPERERQR